MAAMFLQVIILLITVPLSIASMIYGWGLTPENWWFITLGYFPVIISVMISSIVAIIAAAIE